jgi:hypothetical protein
MRKCLGAGQETVWLAAKKLDNIIDKTVLGGEEQIHHTDQNNNGNKVGSVSNGLHQLFDSRILHFVQDQCKDNGKRESQQAVCRKHQCVFNNSFAIVGIEEAFKPLQAYPSAFPNCLDTGIPFEGNNNATHRYIMENNVPDDRRQNKKIQPPVSFYIA